MERFKPVVSSIQIIDTLIFLLPPFPEIFARLFIRYIQRPESISIFPISKDQ